MVIKSLRSHRLCSKPRRNRSHIFKDMLLQLGKSDFFLAMIKEVEPHKARSNWTLMKKNEVNNKK